MVRVFPKSATQPNEMALTICNSISRNCFRLMRDWKLETLANGKEISAVLFRTEKEEYLLRYSTISERNFRKITLPFEFKPKFPDFFGQMVSTPWVDWGHSTTNICFSHYQRCLMDAWTSSLEHYKQQFESVQIGEINSLLKCCRVSCVYPVFLAGKCHQWENQTENSFHFQPRIQIPLILKPSKKKSKKTPDLLEIRNVLLMPECWSGARRQESQKFPYFLSSSSSQFLSPEVILLLVSNKNCRAVIKFWVTCSLVLYTWRKLIPLRVNTINNWQFHL